MDNNLLLRKFEGRTETSGKSGDKEKIENLNMNFIGYKPEQKIHLNDKLKNQQLLDYDYSYVSSIVKEEFNKNINFVPKYRQMKKNNSHLKIYFNKKSENPIKLIKINEQDKTNTNENDNKINMSNKTDNNNHKLDNIDKNKDILLPLINFSDKRREKNILNIKLKRIKSYENKSDLKYNNKSLKQDRPIKIKKIVSNTNIKYKQKINNSFQEKNKIKEIFPLFNIDKKKRLRNNSKFDISNKEKTYNKLLVGYLDYRNNKEKIKDKYSHDFYNENKNINNVQINLNNNNKEKSSLKKKYYDKTNNSTRNEERILYPQKRKKEYTSSDSIKNNLRLKHKLSLISEEEGYKKIENKNNITNDNNNQKNDNFLKILMKQRMLYQNKIPDNSRFKINPKTFVKIDINKII